VLALSVFIFATVGAPSEAPREPEQRPIAPEEKREVPNYDGRGAEPATAGDVLLWVPRVLLSPLYLVSEYGIRRPLGALITTAEKNDWPKVLSKSVVGGVEKGFGVVPTASFDLGLQPSAGVYVWADDAIAQDNQIRARAVTGGFGTVNLLLADRLRLSEREELRARGEYDLRSDRVFHGIGPESPPDPVRFRSHLLAGEVAYERTLWRTSTLTTRIGVRDVRSEDELVETATVLLTGARVALDTRLPREAARLPKASDFVSPPGTGLLALARVEQAAGNRRWITWGGTLGGFGDLGHRRVLGLSVDAEFVDPLGGGESIPITELASLGGSRPLRGFLSRRLIDRSAIALELEYSYPIWIWLDGALHYAAGNVFGEHLEGFDLELFRSSFGLGIKSTGSRDHLFELLAAFGTETFRDGASIEHFRLLAGASAGF
jgi:hypothetical protein